MYQVVKLSHGHLSTNILSHCDHRNTENSERLECIIGLLLIFLLILFLLLSLRALSFLLLECIKVLATQLH